MCHWHALTFTCLIAVVLVSHNNSVNGLEDDRTLCGAIGICEEIEPDLVGASAGWSITGGSVDLEGARRASVRVVPAMS
jgi:hypothetical protein